MPLRQCFLYFYCPQCLLPTGHGCVRLKGTLPSKAAHMAADILLHRLCLEREKEKGCANIGIMDGGCVEPIALFREPGRFFREHNAGI